MAEVNSSHSSDDWGFESLLETSGSNEKKIICPTETESLDWDTDASLHISEHVLSEITQKQMQQIKHLVLGIISEKFKYATDEDIVFLVHKKNNDGSIGKIAGMGMITNASPDLHFSNEEKDKVKVPYLYNFICDPKYKKLKVSVALLYHIKRYVKRANYPRGPCINLNVLNGNKKAEQFFTRNGFVFQHMWDPRVGSYVADTSNTNKDKYDKFVYKSFTYSGNAGTPIVI
jgi:hypothetical protein